MVIGIDIDDTTLKTSAKANEILHRNKEYENIEDYHQLKEDEFKNFVRKNIFEIVNKEDIFPKALEVLKYFKKQKFKIVFITARASNGYDFLISATKKYFKENNISYDKIVFAQEKKGYSAKKNQVDLFIDDKETVLDEIKELGITTLKFDPSNKKSKHKVVTSWQEIKEFVDIEMEVIKNGW